MFAHSFIYPSTEIQIFIDTEVWLAQLNNTINQQDIIDIYRLLHPARVEYMLFSSSHGTLTKVDPILGHKNINLKE